MQDVGRSHRGAPSDNGRSRRAPAFVLAVGATVAMVEAARPFDLDGFWHIRDGDNILANCRIPRHDPFSWTAGSRAWHLNSWLYDVFASLLHRVGGLAAVTTASLLAVVALAWVAYRLARRRGASDTVAAGTAAAATFLIGPWVAERPQVFSYLVFAGVVVFADRALRGSTRATLGLGALIVVWANLHLTFSLGVGIVCLMAGAYAIERRTLAAPVRVSLTALAAGAVNPYGAGAFLIGFQVRSASRYVEEWQPLNIRKPTDILVVAFGVMALSAMWRTQRLGRLRYSLPIGALLLFTVDSMRVAPYMLLVAAPELARAITNRAKRTTTGTATRTSPRRRALLHGSLAAFAVLALTAATRMSIPRPIPDTVFPVKATAAIPAGCRLLNEYDQGGYIVYQRFPDVLVSEDGRNDLYGEDELVAQYHVLNAWPGWQDWLDEHHVGCVLAYPNRPIVPRLQQLGWHTSATDPSAVLLVRPGV